MKIILNARNFDIVNGFTRASKNPLNFPKDVIDKTIELSASRTENGIFESILDISVDAFIIEVPAAYSQKSVDFIKKKNPHMPVILIGDLPSLLEVNGADIYVPFYEMEDDEGIKSLFNILVLNISNYLKSFNKLKKLTTKMSDIIEFGPCKYDPTRRILLHKENEVKKLSAKEGGILEVLSSNFGEIVKKEIILEKVWHKSDYFSGRSMDVYVTHLRRLLKENNIDMTVKNISGVGLILE
jgi:DNA-binding winged helix-turn-helix (wHTH) protein